MVLEGSSTAQNPAFSLEHSSNLRNYTYTKFQVQRCSVKGVIVVAKSSVMVEGQLRVAD